MMDRPNILLLVMDACRADHLFCYGYERDTSPYIDVLSQEGVLFEQAISPAPWSLPAHTSLFTGTYLAAHEAHKGPYDGRYPTLAEALRACGYQTVGFSNVGYVSRSFGLHRGFDHFVEVWRSEPAKNLLRRMSRKLHSLGKNMIGELWGVDSDHGAAETNRQVREWLIARRDYQRPFFLFINYSDIHSPYWPPRRYRDRYLQEVMARPGGKVPPRVRQISEQPLDYITGRISLGTHDFETLQALYDGGIRYLDAKIGELLDTLDRAKVLDDALVIITSDHGDNLGEHGLVGHVLCLYDTLLHIPLIARFPKRFPAGLRISPQVQLVDLFPTILELIGIEDTGLWRSVQGMSLLPCLAGLEHRQFAVAEYGRPNILKIICEKYPEFRTSTYDRELKAIRAAGLKYIWGSDGRCELYNIVKDPMESHNLIHTKAEKAAELHSQLMDWYEQHSAATQRTHSEECEIDEATVKRLRALGYID